MRILVTRPEPDASAFAVALEALGVTGLVLPLTRTVFLPVPEASLSSARALIATSRNGLRALAQSRALANALAMELFVVGPGTAQLAQELGFSSIHQGAGDAAALGPLIVAKLNPATGPLLHLAGDVLTGRLDTTLRAQGFEVAAPVVYRVEADQSQKPELARVLAAGDVDGVALFSPRSAQIFCDFVIAGALEPQARHLQILCLSPQVARGVLVHPGAVARDKITICAQPNSKEMLALVRVAAQKHRDRC